MCTGAKFPPFIWRKSWTQKDITFTALGGKVSARKELGNALINSRRQTGQVACGLASRTHGASAMHSAARVTAVTKRMRENRSHSRPTERDENLTAALIIKRIPAPHMRGEQSLRVLTSGYVLTRDSESFISNYEGPNRTGPFPLGPSKSLYELRPGS